MSAAVTFVKLSSDGSLLPNANDKPCTLTLTLDVKVSSPTVATALT